MYHCVKCGAIATVEGEEKQKSCSCEAPIAAEMAGTAHGTGGIKM